MNKSKQWDTYHTDAIKAQSLYRYVNKKKLLSFLKDKALYMPAMYRFDDKLEGISTYDITELRTCYETCFDDDTDVLPNMQEHYRNLKERSADYLELLSERIIQTQQGHYVNCWFSSNRESDGMWRFYADEGGFAIKVDRNQLQSLMKNSISENALSRKRTLIAGKVCYQDFPKVIENEQASLVKYLAFRKDLSFSHESEYRFVIRDTSLEEKPDHILYKINGFENLEITVIPHPAMEEKHFQECKVEFESLGNNIKVERSELEPFYQLFNRIKEIKK